MIEIPLSKGQVAIVDDDTPAEVLTQKWYAYWSPSPKTYYAVRTEIRADGKRRQIYMHRVLLGVTNPKIQVDHRNAIGTDNQKTNLRICTPAQNQANRPPTGGRSRFKGVYWDARCRKWFSQIRVNHKTHYLGIKESEEAAALAYNAAAIELCGEFAFLNVVPSIGESSNEWISESASAPTVGDEATATDGTTAAGNTQLAE